jgi:hypothetical protein
MTLRNAKKGKSSLINIIFILYGQKMVKARISFRSSKNSKKLFQSFLKSTRYFKELILHRDLAKFSRFYSRQRKSL